MRSNRKRINSPALTLFLSALIVSIMGCSGLKALNMVPVTAKQNPTNISSKTVRVAEITGGRESTFGGAEMVTNELLKSALFEALQQGKLFRAVVMEGDSNLDVQANIVSQGQKIGSFLEYRHNMIINYKFIDRNQDLSSCVKPTNLSLDHARSLVALEQ